MTNLRHISRFTSLLSVLTSALFALWRCGAPPPDSHVDNSSPPSGFDSQQSDHGEVNHLLRPFATPTGRIQTFTLSGEIDTENPFFNLRAWAPTVEAATPVTKPAMAGPSRLDTCRQDSTRAMVSIPSFARMTEPIRPTSTILPWKHAGRGTACFSIRA